MIYKIFGTNKIPQDKAATFGYTPFSTYSLEEMAEYINTHAVVTCELEGGHRSTKNVKEIYPWIRLDIDVEGEAEKVDKALKNVLHIKKPSTSHDTNPYKFHYFIPIENVSQNYNTYKLQYYQFLADFGIDIKDKSLASVVQNTNPYKGTTVKAEIISGKVWTAPHKETPKRKELKEKHSEVSKNDVKKALKKLDPDMVYISQEKDSKPYWIGVGMALYDWCPKRGLKLFDKWSKGSDKYDGTTIDKWDDFSKNAKGDVTIGSLLYWAYGEKKDPTDLFKQEKGSVKPLTKKKNKKKKYSRIISSSKFIQSFKPSKWLINEILPNAELGELFGPSMSRKTFIALDIGTCIHNGIAWQGHKTFKADVLYIVGEGVNGVRNRLSAFAINYGVEECMDILPTPVDMMSAENMEELADDIELLDKKYGLIIIDTLNANFSGDEDSAKDFALMKKNLQKTIAKEDRMVMWVHHTGNSEGHRGRGSSARFAGIDTSMKVTAKGEYSHLENTKQKDAEMFKGMKFGFKSVKTGLVDEAMQPLYSIVPKLEGLLDDDENKKDFNNNEGMIAVMRELVEKKDFMMLDEADEIIQIKKVHLRNNSKETIFKGHSNYRIALKRWYEDALKYEIILKNETDHIVLKKSILYTV